MIHSVALFNPQQSPEVEYIILLCVWGVKTWTWSWVTDWHVSASIIPGGRWKNLHGPHFEELDLGSWPRTAQPQPQRLMWQQLLKSNQYWVV